MKIDAHVHIAAYPSLDEGIGRILKGLAGDGFNKAVLLPDYEVPKNDDVAYAMRKAPGLFYGIFVLDFQRPLAEVKEEFDARLASGFKGIKLHPRFQSIDLNKETEKAILAACNEKQIPVLIDGFMRQNDEGAAQMNFLRQAVGMLSQTKVAIAHFGAQRYREVLALAAAHKNVYMDLSSSLLFFLSTLPDMVNDMCRLVKESGGERFLYGSDYPIFEIGTYARQTELFLRNAGLTDKQMERIFGGTAAGIFG